MLRSLLLLNTRTDADSRQKVRATFFFSWSVLFYDLGWKHVGKSTHKCDSCFTVVVCCRCVIKERKPMIDDIDKKAHAIHPSFFPFWGVRSLLVSCYASYWCFFAARCSASECRSTRSRPPRTGCRSITTCATTSTSCTCPRRSWS